VYQIPTATALPVHQYGLRKLWNEVEAAHGWWVDHGKPGADRWRSP